LLTPDDYDAYKSRQRREKDSRKQFLTVARLEEAGSPLTDAQLAEQAAAVTQNKPAPVELVRDNRESFCRVVGNNKLDAIRASAPKLFAYLGDPDGAAISRDDFVRLAMIERVASDGGIIPPSSQAADPKAIGKADPKMRAAAERIARNGWYMSPVPEAKDKDPTSMSMPEYLWAGYKETLRSTARGVVSGLVGKSLEGTGQLASGLSDSFVYPNTRGQYDLARRISQARYVPKEEVEAINRDIDKLVAATQPYAATSFGQAQSAQIEIIRRTLSNVLDGSMQPNDAFKRVQPMFGGLSRMVAETTTGKRAALSERISQSKNISKRQLAAIERDIDLLLPWRPERDAVQDMLGRVRSGVIEPAKALDSLRRMLDFPLDTLGKDLQQAGEAVQDFAEEKIKPAKGFEDSIFRQMGEAGGVAAGIAAVTALSFGGGIALAGAAGAGSGSADARKANPTNEIAQTQAALAGVPLGLLDVAPVERVLFTPAVMSEKFLPRAAEWFAKRSITEGIKNAGQQWLQNVSAMNIYDPSRSWDSGVWDSFLSGAVISGIFDAGGAVLRAFSGKEVQAQAAEQQQATLQTVFDQSAVSTTRKRSPEAFESYLGHVIKDGPIGNVHLQARIFDDYYRSRGIDPLTIIDTLTGVTRTDFAAAMTSGSDLRIPTATYATRIVGSDADLALRPHLRVDPDGMTPAELNIFKQHKDEARRQAEDARFRAEGEARRVAAQEVRDAMTAELNAAGYSPEAAASEALLRSTLHRTTATRAGTRPTTLTIPASPEALLRSDVSVLNDDALMNSTSPLALDGRKKVVPSDVLPETMNAAPRLVDPNPQYGPDRPREHWEK